MEKAKTLNREYTMEDFKVTNEKKLAEASARAIITTPGCYNPVYLQGKSGSGKTYLLNAIGNKMLDTNPDYEIVYKTINQLKTELNETKEEDFINNYSNVDCLLIDDLESIEDNNNEKLQDALLNILTELINNKKQVVLASKKDTSELKNINGKLLYKFENGVIAGLSSNY